MTQTPSSALEHLYLNESKALADAMNEKYGSYIAGRQFSISAHETDGALYVTTLLKNNDESFYYPVSTRIDYKAEELERFEAFAFLVDYIDVYFEEYLSEDGELFLPIDWTAHRYDAVDFQIKGQVLNHKMEKMAGALLGEMT